VNRAGFAARGAVCLADVAELLELRAYCALKFSAKNLPRMHGEACGDGLCIRTVGKSLRVPAVIGWRNGCAATLAYAGGRRTGWVGNLVHHLHFMMRLMLALRYSLNLSQTLVCRLAISSLWSSRRFSSV
jgi:hypothetical protein